MISIVSDIITVSIPFCITKDNDASNSWINAWCISISVSFKIIVSTDALNLVSMMIFAAFLCLWLSGVD